MRKGSLVVVVLAVLASLALARPSAEARQASPKDGDVGAQVSASEWTFCVNAGNVCLFTGLRVVRLADATGTRSVTQVAYHSVPCAIYGFQDRKPADGPLHCDISPPLMDTLPVPHAMAPVAASKIVVPKASPGSRSKDVQASAENGIYTDGSGSFRTTCSLAKYAFEDPIVYPKQHGVSHLHAFFGNTDMDANTTSESIVANGNSTCRGGILNRTAYWTPAVIAGDGSTVMPDEATIYYKTGYGMNPATIQVLPTGLRMVAGDKNAKGAQQYITWMCLTPNLTGAGIPDGPTIPAGCRPGNFVRLNVIFPQCWDGKNLDAPDHKSHMAYPVYGSPSHCPSSHPVALPEITEHFDYPVVPGANPATWRLSSDMYEASKRGGLSAHADWMMGWDSATIKSIVQNCLNKALDCGVGGIGGNKALF